MRACFQIEIVTPKGIVLNGLWFGTKKPDQIIIWVHGLGSSMFSKLRIVELLAKRRTAVIVFNNRGHDEISRLARLDGKQGAWAGAAHERFMDSADDIQGAVNFARRAGVKRIFLAGHSTGCQKSIYWAAKGGRGVKGIILLAPVSDYAATSWMFGRKKLAKVTAFARALIQKGKSAELLPNSLWPETVDAQRFISLYTPDSPEELFTYGQPKKKPRALQKIRIPILALWAEREEFSNRPAGEIAAWFTKHLKAKDTFAIIPEAGHGFRGGEKAVAKAVAAFMKER